MTDKTQQLINSLAGLVSESRNPASNDIDMLDSLGIVSLINDADKQVSIAIEHVLPAIAQAVDEIVAAMKLGGRLVYMGAGTSGRMGVLDAVECVPTFGVSNDQVTALMAGGEAAMFRAREGVEDDGQAGIEDLKAIEFTDQDILVGIAASGRTPYVQSAMQHAQSVGAKTIALSCNPDAMIAKQADIAILPVVGPEVLTGSTRMKAGTAQKLVLNMLSTASMIRLGKSYHNLMVDVQATNDKLKARGQRMIMEVAGVDQAVAVKTLEAANGQVKTALFMLLSDCDRATAETELAAAEGFLRRALSARGADQ